VVNFGLHDCEPGVDAEAYVGSFLFFIYVIWEGKVLLYIYIYHISLYREEEAYVGDGYPAQKWVLLLVWGMNAGRL
jgi:hypothetical protein